MSDNLPDVAALTAEARTLAKAYVGVGHRHGVENLLTRLADSLESLSARVTQAEARAKRWEDLAVQSAEELNALNERRAIKARWTAAVGERARIALSPGAGNEASA